MKMFIFCLYMMSFTSALFGGDHPDFALGTFIASDVCQFSPRGIKKIESVTIAPGSTKTVRRKITYTRKELVDLNFQKDDAIYIYLSEDNYFFNDHYEHRIMGKIPSWDAVDSVEYGIEINLNSKYSQRLYNKQTFNLNYLYNQATFKVHVQIIKQKDFSQDRSLQVEESSLFDPFVNTKTRLEVLVVDLESGDCEDQDCFGGDPDLKISAYFKNAAEVIKEKKSVIETMKTNSVRPNTQDYSYQNVKEGTQLTLHKISSSITGLHNNGVSVYEDENSGDVLYLDFTEAGLWGSETPLLTEPLKVNLAQLLKNHEHHIKNIPEVTGSWTTSSALIELEQQILLKSVFAKPAKAKVIVNLVTEK